MKALRQFKGTVKKILIYFTKNKDFMIKILVVFQKLDFSNHGSFGLYALITLLGLK